MNPLKMDKRITIQAYETYKEDGITYQEWRDKQTVWARVFTVSAKEIFSAGADYSSIVLRFVIRANSSLELDANMRIKFKGLGYDIESILNDD
ncbi:phage head closure protein, partial [Escherichia coli]|nr:phage head closure protein [Escherichia coli]